MSIDFNGRRVETDPRGCLMRKVMLAV